LPQNNINHNDEKGDHMKDTPKWLVLFVEFLIDNFTLLATLIFASYVIYQQELSNTKLSTEDLLTAILAVLSLLAISEIVERYRKLNRIEENSKNIFTLLKNKILERPSAMVFFQKPESLEEDIHSYITSANNIDLCGLTLTNAVNKNLSILRERLKQGAKVRILIADPKSLAPKMSTLRSEDPTDFSYFKGRLDTALRDIDFLYRDWMEWKTQNPRISKKGDFAVRLLCYAPSFGIRCFDGNEKDGNIIVDIHPHKSGFSSPPTFSLTYKRDEKWYEYFQSQFEQMWADAKEWKPKNM
jgi:hypothetical protein